MKIINVDWNTYLDVFPDRYINLGPFDDLINKTVTNLLNKNKTIDALDVGGGKEGTLALKNPNIKTWLVDPFITNLPEWMISNWKNLKAIPNDNNQKYHLIVARGSFNYLTGIEMRCICDRLKSGGIFLFNTFMLPKTGERSYVNSKTQIKGIERYYDEGRIIRHQLIPENGENIIEHNFYIWSKKMIEFLLHDLGGLELTITQEKNSLYIMATKL